MSRTLRHTSVVNLGKLTPVHTTSTMSTVSMQGILVGLSTIDLVYEVNEFPAPNSKVNARSQEASIGGPATNAAITFSNLGGKATLVTGIGRYRFGDLIREEINSYSVTLRDIAPEFEGVPVISSVTVDKAGRRSVVSANANRIPVQHSEVDRELLRSTSVLMVDGHFMEVCRAWAEAAHGIGIKVVLDAGSWKPGLEKLLPHVHTAICSADFRPPRCSNQDDFMLFLRNYGVAEIAISAGAEPIKFANAKSTGAIPVPRVDAVDTNGAGDVLHGAYCFYAGIGMGFPAALEHAARIATESVRFRGISGWVRSRNIVAIEHG